MDAGEWLVWAITKDKSPDYIGSIVLWNYNSDQNKAELGYSLLATEQRRGYMQEALRVIIHYSFIGLNLECLEAFTSVDNSPSLRLLQVLNFTREGEVLETLPSGIRMNLASHKLLRGDYLK